MSWYASSCPPRTGHLKGRQHRLWSLPQRRALALSLARSRSFHASRRTQGWNEEVLRPVRFPSLARLARPESQRADAAAAALSLSFLFPTARARRSCRRRARSSVRPTLSLILKSASTARQSASCVRTSPLEDEDADVERRSRLEKEMNSLQKDAKSYLDAMRCKLSPSPVLAQNSRG